MSRFAKHRPADVLIELMMWTIGYCQTHVIDQYFVYKNKKEYANFSFLYQDHLGHLFFILYSKLILYKIKMFVNYKYKG